MRYLNPPLHGHTLATTAFHCSEWFFEAHQLAMGLQPTRTIPSNNVYRCSNNLENHNYGRPANSKLAHCLRA